MTSLANTETGGRLVLLKGEAADAAPTVQMVNRVDTKLERTGPWVADLEGVRDDAIEEGFAQGLSEGRKAGREAARQAANAQSAKAVSALDDLVTAMDEREEALGADFSDQVASLALTVAEAILSRELAVSIDPGKEAIARCLVDAPRGGDVIANLNPKDIETLGHLESILDGRRVTIVPDPSLASGDAMVLVGDTNIDGRLSDAMDRVREVLR